MSDKDFSKYAYFICKASNFAIVIKPNKKKIVDGEVVYEEGLRLEFKNKMLRIEKTEENEGLLIKLRQKLKDEEAIDPKRRSFFEEQKPKEMVAMDQVEELLGEKIGEKNERIAQLEKENELLKKGLVQTPAVNLSAAISNASDDENKVVTPHTPRKR